MLLHPVPHWKPGWIITLSIFIAYPPFVGFVSEQVFRPVMAPVASLLDGCEEIPRVEDTDEEECSRDASITGEPLQSLALSLLGRRRSSQTSDYFSIGVGSSPRQSICLSEEGEAAILEEVDSVMLTEDEQGLGDGGGDARSDSHCESNVQSVRGTPYSLDLVYLLRRPIMLMKVCMKTNFTSIGNDI